MQAHIGGVVMGSPAERSSLPRRVRIMRPQRLSLVVVSPRSCCYAPPRPPNGYATVSASASTSNKLLRGGTTIFAEIRFNGVN